jgi:hypothetical protein
MKLPPSSRIEKCVSTSPLHERLLSVYLDAPSKKAVATNGQIIAVVPVETDPGEVSGRISTKAFACARKAVKKGEPVIVQVDNQNGRGTPFDWEIVCSKDMPRLTIALDAKQLLKLAEALSRDGATTVKLEIVDEHTKIRVTGNLPEAYGYIVPKRIEW